MKCDCGSLKDYGVCCGRFIDGHESAASAEALMRSRYTAFVRKNMDYIKETHDPQTKDQFDLASTKDWAHSVDFKSLEILRAEEAGNKAVVEFRAIFQDIATKNQTIHHEVSKFRKQKGIWFFREGKVTSEAEKK